MSLKINDRVRIKKEIEDYELNDIGIDYKNIIDILRSSDGTITSPEREEESFDGVLRTFVDVKFDLDNNVWWGFEPYMLEKIK